MAAIAGAVLAATGIAYYGVSAVSQTGEVRKEEEQGTYRNRFVDTSHVILDRYHESWNSHQPIEAVTSGVWGIPKTNYQQPGKGIVLAYGVPNGNSMTKV